MAPPIVKNYGQSVLQAMADAARARRMPAEIPTPRYLGRGFGTPTISNRAPFPGAQPGGGGGALVRQGPRDLASLGERGMRYIGGGQTTGAQGAFQRPAGFANKTPGIGTQGPFTAGPGGNALTRLGEQGLATIPTAVVGSELGFGSKLAGLLKSGMRGLAGPAGVALSTATMDKPPSLGGLSSEDHEDVRNDPMAQDALEDERVQFSDMDGMSHAGSFSGVRDFPAGYNGVDEEGVPLMRGMLGPEGFVDVQSRGLRHGMEPGGGLPGDPDKLGTNMSTPASLLDGLSRGMGGGEISADGANIVNSLSAKVAAQAAPQVPPRARTRSVVASQGTDTERQSLARVTGAFKNPIFQDDQSDQIPGTAGGELTPEVFASTPSMPNSEISNRPLGEVPPALLAGLAGPAGAALVMPKEPSQLRALPSKYGSPMSPLLTGMSGGRRVGIRAR